MPVRAWGLIIDTPSPEVKKSHFKMTSPKGACRQIFNSPVLNRKGLCDLNELTMSPLQLEDSPIRANIAPMTPSTSSCSVNGSPRKSPRFLKQTSTPSDDIHPDTPTNKDKAFMVETNTSVFSKAKRRLIDDSVHSPTASKPLPFSSPTIHGNIAKKIKVTPRSVKRSSVRYQSKKRYGCINAGVGHRIRRPKPNVRKESTIVKKVPTVAQLEDISVAAPAASNEKENVPEVASPQVAKTVIPELSAEEKFTRILERPGQVKEPVNTFKSLSNLNESIQKVEKKLEIVPKVITRNWNRGLREPKERRFFKSRDTPDQLQNRVVTVSVNDNLKLHIREKPLRKSPRKSKWLQESEDPTSATEKETCVDLLHQDWDDGGDVVDLSTNIQQILDNLTDDESSNDATPASLPSAAETDATPKSSSAKLFPLFYKDGVKNAAVTQRPATKSASTKAQWIRARNDGENQMILDAGQKVYGAVQCPECMLVYHVKEPEDELLHTKIHESLKDALKFPGWKKERIVRRFNNDAYIIVVHPGDAVHCWNKVHNILKTVVDNELGFSDIGIRKPDSTKVYMYIGDKKVTGVLVAESIPHGYRMLSSAPHSQGKCCSSEPEPVTCGVSRVWTLASYRRNKVATRLLDAMRSEFVYGQFVGMDHLAFSDPTENGLAFAQHYTKRTDFLVYNM